MEKLKAEIYDIYNVLQNTLIGTFEKGAFKYEVGGYKIPFTQMRFFPIIKSLDCDLNGSYRRGKDKCVSYIFDGIKYTQRFFNNSKIDSSSELYLSDIEKGMMAKELALDKPMDLNRIIDFLFMIMIMAGVALNYFQGVQIAKANQPIQNISAQIYHQQFIDNNKTLQLYKMFNQTQQVNKALLSYIQFNTKTS